MEKLYTVNEKKKKRPRADCVSDHQLLIAKFRLKWKKVGKTNRSYSYYTVEVTNRLKELDLVERRTMDRGS